MRKWAPGIIAGGADNDPAGIATYAISGAQFGYDQLWIMAWATPMLIAVQSMCARLGLVKKKGLAAIIKDHYSPYIVWIAASVLVFANVLTIGADLAGIGAAVGLLTNTQYVFWVIPAALIIWYLVLFLNFTKIRRYLLYLSFIFITYILAAYLAKPDWHSVAKHLVFPSLSFQAPFLMGALGLLGTTITPYLFFWQVQEEVEEKPKAKDAAVDAKDEESILAPGFIVSNIVSLCIMIATASVLHGHGTNDIGSADQAAKVLEPFAGVYAKYLFAFGIIGAGFLAIPILAASSSAAIAEVFGWRDSLSDKVNHAKGFYIAITLSILFGAVIALAHIDPIKILYYSQIADGMLGPILITIILFMCNDKKLMGLYINRAFDNLFGTLAVVVMVVSSIALIAQLLKII